MPYLQLLKRKKLNRERAKLAMRAAIAESEGASFDMQEEEEALENIPGSLWAHGSANKISLFYRFHFFYISYFFITIHIRDRGLFCAQEHTWSTAIIRGHCMV